MKCSTSSDIEIVLVLEENKRGLRQMSDLLSEAQAAGAESIGLKKDKVIELLQRVQQEVKEGLLPSTQIALARNGKVGIFESYGN